MKAASNALSLSTRCIEHPSVVDELVGVAEEELAHFRLVLGELRRRGFALGAPEEDWYAAELRRRSSKTRVRHDLASFVLTDRLVVAAFIEARSCERFKLLRDALRESDPRLASFYEDLLASEARHHRTFLDLAVLVSGDARHVAERREVVAAIEAEVVRELSHQPTMHG
jgi:tRNA 2-(methylsulfanyl)-N6-isopentenyladenosine37 hydroxylase